MCFRSVFANRLGGGSHAAGRFAQRSPRWPSSPVLSSSGKRGWETVHLHAMQSNHRQGQGQLNDSRSHDDLMGLYCWARRRIPKPLCPLARPRTLRTMHTADGVALCPIPKPQTAPVSSLPCVALEGDSSPSVVLPLLFFSPGDRDNGPEILI